MWLSKQEASHVMQSTAFQIYRFCLCFTSQQLSVVAVLSTRTLSHFNYLMDFQQPCLLLHSQKQQRSLGKPQPVTHSTVCVCMYTHTHTSFVWDRKVGKWCRKWQSCMIRGELVITGLCVWMSASVCACGKEKSAKWYQWFRVQSPVWTAQQGNRERNK